MIDQKKNTQAYGQLVTAVASGGVETLWRLGQRPGPVGDLARMALDKVTSPNSNYSAVEAVSFVVKGGKA